MTSIGEKIKFIRQSRNLKQGDLARKLGMTSAQLCRIEGAKNPPSVKTIARIAKVLQLPISELMSDSNQGAASAKHCSSDDIRIYAPDEAQPSNEHSSLLAIRETSEPASELDSIKRQLIKKNDEYISIEGELGVQTATSLQLSHIYSFDDNGAEALARSFRTSCNAGFSPFVNMLGILESRNLRLVFVNCSKEIQSRSFFDTASRVLMIAINKRLIPERQLYRIAYELGYACLFGSNGFTTVNELPQTHRFIRRFASAMLMPDDILRSISSQLALGPDNWTMPMLLNLKSKFGVTAETFAHRLEKIGLLSPSLRKRFKEELRNYYEEHDNAEPSPTIKQLQIDSHLSLLKLRTAK